MTENTKNFKYRLYLAAGIRLWNNYFRKKYSKYFNRKVYLFEPGKSDFPKDHRKIPIQIACYDLDEINHADALLVYMKRYKTPDNSPIGTDSTWECGYAIGHSKPVIMLIEDTKHIDYYASQWMVAYSINAILTDNEAVANIVKNHQKFVHTTVLLAQNKDQFESKIIEYLNEYYRSIYSRSGIINYYVDKQARKLFSRINLTKNVFLNSTTDNNISRILKKLKKLKFKSDKDSFIVCEVEREISDYLRESFKFDSPKTCEAKVDKAISTVINEWDQEPEHILDCLEHSIKPPFMKVKGRKQGIKKTRPELFYELYHIITHHLVSEQRFVKDEHYPYKIGAIIELYNWMNTYALDDVFDNSKYRQKLTTVWNEFTRKDGIYTGIIGHLLALKYFFNITTENNYIGKRLADIMNEYNFMMYQGQLIDLILTFDSDKKKKLLWQHNLDYLIKLYIQRIYGICGGFYEAIGKMSVVCENKDQQIINGDEIEIVSPFIGMYYGIIQMIRNDLGDYILINEFSKLNKGMKGTSHSDIREGKTDIAYLIAIYSPILNQKEKKFLIDALYSKLTIKDKLKINELLWRTGAIDATVEIINRIIKHVESILITEYQETPTRTKWMFKLIDITNKILVPFRKEALKNKWYKYEFDPELVEKISNEIMSLEKKNKKQRLSEFEVFKNINFE